MDGTDDQHLSEILFREVENGLPSLILLKTCHPLSFRFPTFSHFGQYGVSQLSTRKYRTVVEQVLLGLPSGTHSLKMLILVLGTSGTKDFRKIVTGVEGGD